MALSYMSSNDVIIAPLATPSQLAVGMALILLVVAEFRAYLGVCASHQPLRPAALLES